MSDRSITVNIAGRVYPLTVSAGDEPKVRDAEKLINDRIKEYESNYSVRDKQDLLAMCALQLATHNIKLENRPGSEEGELAGKLTEMEALISGYLDKGKNVL
jgi:cell division protein ZapA (FtsZ GTPase activity inhibitor)